MRQDGRRSLSGETSNPQPRKKRSRQSTKKVEHAADEDVADEVLTPDWEARGARADQGRGPSQSRDAEVDHLDVPDVKDVQAVVPYLTEIHQHYRDTEGLKDARYGYMSNQWDINSKMRAILFDWLLEVHGKFKLVPETLFMTFGLIDRYLEKEKIMRSRLQLVGMTAMFIASKYEEIFAPECRTWSKARPLLPFRARPVGCGEGSKAPHSDSSPPTRSQATPFYPCLTCRRRHRRGAPVVPQARRRAATQRLLSTKQVHRLDLHLGPRVQQGGPPAHGEQHPRHARLPASRQVGQGQPRCRQAGSLWRGTPGARQPHAGARPAPCVRPEGSATRRRTLGKEGPVLTWLCTPPPRADLPC